MTTPIDRRANAAAWATLALAILTHGCASTAPVQERFDSPTQAAQALVESLRTGDDAARTRILGPDGNDLLSSGDATADRDDIRAFVAAYQSKHRLLPAAGGGMTLAVGEADWPYPVPIVENAGTGQWSFDTARGKNEVLNRRIGENELCAAQVCLAITDAERDYAMDDLDGSGLHDYARALLGTPGQKNGLYWETPDGAPPSPLGALVAAAEDIPAEPAARPYHGYYYRILCAQGPHAEGGAMDYCVGDRMLGGFGVLAFPAAYRDSGVMTFMTNHRGVVYQKDLGPDTARIARSLQAFDPGPGWTVTDTETTVSRDR